MSIGGIDDIIEELLGASQKPFDNRLEVVCYLWLDSNKPGSQEIQHMLAKNLAAYLVDNMRIDVDQGPLS